MDILSTEQGQLSEKPRQFENTSLVALVDSYIRYYATGSSHTARAKRLDLDHFLKFLNEFHGYSRTQKLRVKDWDFATTQRFIEESLGKGEAVSTVARRLATIKHMGRTIAERVKGFVNPAREVRAPKIKPPKPKALTLSELRKARQVASTRLRSKDSFIRLRNQTLFEFLIDTGLRADEVRLLKLGQLDSKLEWISNVRTKGKRFRNVYITSEMRPGLKSYLVARSRELNRFFHRLTKSQDNSLPLFISTYGAKSIKPETFLMGSKTIWRAVQELSSQTELHPHLLRHSFAIDLLEHSRDVRLVAQALGHSDVRTTMRYTERMDQEVAAALEKSRKTRTRR